MTIYESERNREIEKHKREKKSRSKETQRLILEARIHFFPLSSGRALILQIRKNSRPPSSLCVSLYCIFILIGFWNRELLQYSHKILKNKKTMVLFEKRTLEAPWSLQFFLRPGSHPIFDFFPWFCSFSRPFPSFSESMLRIFATSCSFKWEK